MRLPPLRLAASAAAVLLLLFPFAHRAVSQSTLVPLPARRGMVFDSSSSFLYVATSDGYVRRYNVASAELDRNYNLGGSLRGVDIAPDDSFLLVAQGAIGLTQGVLHRVDLATGTTATVTYPLISGEGGSWQVAISRNGRALFTSTHPGSGPVPLRQLDLGTNTVSERPDAPGYSFAGRIYGGTQLIRTENRDRTYLLGGHSAGQVFSYEAATNSFGPNINTGYDLDYGSVAIEPGGSLLAARVGSKILVDALPGYRFRRSIRGRDGGIAFDGPHGRLFAVDRSTSTVIAYDTGTFAELFRIPLGEEVRTTPTQFESGTMIASPDGRYLAVRSTGGIRLLTIPPQPSSPPPPPPSFGSPRGLVFDHAGERLYITTAEGWVWPYELASDTLKVPYNVGGFLNGIDIAADDSYLVVAQSDAGLAEGGFQKIDLKTGAITNLNYRRVSNSQTGTWDIAIGSTGIALGTSEVSFGGVPLYQIDLATGAVLERTGTPGSSPGGTLTTQAQLQRSADGSRMYVLESLSSTGRVFTYSSEANAFGPARDLGAYLYSSSGAVNRNGTLLATRRPAVATAVQTAPDLGPVTSLSNIDGGIAFDGVRDLVYGVSSYSSQIIGYDAHTSAERFRFDVGENTPAGAGKFYRGILVASPDGRHLALNTGTRVRVYDVPAVPLLSVASVKTHDADAFSVDLPLNGPRAVECRSGGAGGNHTLVFTFATPLQSTGSASVTAGTGTAGPPTIDSSDPRRCIVNLTGVNNAQVVRVTLSDLRDSATNYTALLSAQFAVLVGDINGDRTVNSGDAMQARTNSGSDISTANFRADVNADGAINSADALLVRARNGSSLPSTP
jgi:hypothetical protein